MKLFFRLTLCTLWCFFFISTLFVPISIRVEPQKNITINLPLVHGYEASEIKDNESNYFVEIESFSFTAAVIQSVKGFLSITLDKIGGIAGAFFFSDDQVKIADEPISNDSDTKTVTASSKKDIFNNSASQSANVSNSITSFSTSNTNNSSDDFTSTIETKTFAQAEQDTAPTSISENISQTESIAKPTTNSESSITYNIVGLSQSELTTRLDAYKTEVGNLIQNMTNNLLRKETNKLQSDEDNNNISKSIKKVNSRIDGLDLTVTSDSGVATFSTLTVDTDTLVVDSILNRIGMGTSSPSEMLSVEGNGLITGSLTSASLVTGSIDLSNGTISNGYLQGITLGGDINGNYYTISDAILDTPTLIGAVLGGDMDAIGTYRITNLFGGTAANPGISFTGGGGINASSGAVGIVTNSEERISITDTGNVGIGTTSPYAKLSVAGTVVGSNFIGTSTVASKFGGNIILTNTSPLIAVDTTSGADSKFLALSGGGAIGSDRGANIYLEGNEYMSEYNGRLILAAGNAAGTDTDGAISFWTENSRERMTITRDGEVGIGTSTPSAQLTTTGTVRFANFGAGTLQTDANGNLSVSSDERLKNIKGFFTRGLDSIKGINTINYTWKPESGLETEGEYTGFSAQNVKEYIPEAVGVDNRGFFTLSDRGILATVVNAVKELGGFVDRVEDGVGYLKTIVVKKITAEKITIHNETDPSKTGITIYDRETNEPVCMFVSDGTVETENGTCEDVHETEEDTSFSNNSNNNDTDKEEITETNTTVSSTTATSSLNNLLPDLPSDTPNDDGVQKQVEGESPSLKSESEDTTIEKDNEKEKIEITEQKETPTEEPTENKEENKIAE